MEMAIRMRSRDLFEAKLRGAFYALVMILKLAMVNIVPFPSPSFDQTPISHNFSFLIPHSSFPIHHPLSSRITLPSYDSSCQISYRILHLSPPFGSDKSNESNESNESTSNIRQGIFSLNGLVLTIDGKPLARSGYFLFLKKPRSLLQSRFELVKRPLIVEAE